jgi:excisionase family DNA binding protein
MDEIFTDGIFTGETARILNVNEDTVRRLESRGELCAKRIGPGVRLFSRAEAEQLVAKRAAARAARRA